MCSTVTRDSRIHRTGGGGTGGARGGGAGRLGPVSDAPITYASAGVDVEAGDKAVELMKASVRRATRPEVVGGLGGVAGLVDASAVARGSPPVPAPRPPRVGAQGGLAPAPRG